jgi:hypothetical protein
MNTQVSGDDKRWSEFYRPQEVMNGRMRIKCRGRERSRGENEKEGEEMNEC